MIGALVATVALVRMCAQDADGGPGGRPAPVPGVRRFVSSDRLITLEVRDPSSNIPREGPLEVTFRSVQRSSAEAAPSPTPVGTFERDYAPLGEADSVLAVGGLSGPPTTAAVLGSDGSFAALTKLGLEVFGPDGAALFTVTAQRLRESSGEVIRLGDLTRLVDASTSHTPSRTPRPGFEVGAALIPHDGALVLARRLEAAPHDPAAAWSVQRIDLDSRAIAPAALRELVLPVELVAASPEADVLVALAALDGRIELLRAVVPDERVPLAARLRAAWHLGDEARDRGSALVTVALAGAEDPRSDGHTVLVALSAARRFATAETLQHVVALLAGSPYELTATELLTSLGAPAFEALAAATFAAPTSDAVETGLHRALLAVAESDDPALEGSVERFVTEVLARPDVPSRQTLLRVVDQGRLRHPRLAGALDAAQLRAFLERGERLERWNPHVTPHRAVVGVLVESLDAPVSKERLSERLVVLAAIADLTAQRTVQVQGPALTAEAWRTWWNDAQERPQAAELMAHATAGRYVALGRGVEACLAAGDRVHRSVAAGALTAVGAQLERAGLRPIAERVLEGWRPADADEQATRQALREVVAGRRDGR